MRVRFQLLRVLAAAVVLAGPVLGYLLSYATYLGLAAVRG